MLCPFLVWSFFLTFIIRTGNGKIINVTHSLSDLGKKELELRITIRLDGLQKDESVTNKSDGNAFTYHSSLHNEIDDKHGPSKTCQDDDSQIREGRNRMVNALMIQRGVLKYPTDLVSKNIIDKVKLPVSETAGLLRSPSKQMVNKAFMMFHGKRSLRGKYNKHGKNHGNRSQRLHKRSLVQRAGKHVETSNDQFNEKSLKEMKRSYWKNNIRSSPYYGWKRMNTNWNWYGYRSHGHSLDTLASNIIGKRST